MDKHPVISGIIAGLFVTFVAWIADKMYVFLKIPTTLRPLNKLVLVPTWLFLLLGTLAIGALLIAALWFISPLRNATAQKLRYRRERARRRKTVLAALKDMSGTFKVATVGQLVEEVEKREEGLWGRVSIVPELIEMRKERLIYWPGSAFQLSSSLQVVMYDDRDILISPVSPSQSIEESQSKE